MPLRLTTWNVNGIRNPLTYYQAWHILKDILDTLEADIVVFQELKIQHKDLTDDMVLIPGWDCFISLPKTKKGYSGVGIYTRQSKCVPHRAEEGLTGVLTPPRSSIMYRDMAPAECIGGYPTLDQIADLTVTPANIDLEGRCVVLEFPAFVLIGLYCPANTNGTQEDFRYDFFQCLNHRIRNLTAMGKRVVVMGDLNVSGDVIDSASALLDISQGMSLTDFFESPCRKIFNDLLDGLPGNILVDVPRHFHPDREKMYTHWDQRLNYRPSNVGSRIDHILSSASTLDWFYQSDIQADLKGSDHCPVYAIMNDEVYVEFENEGEDGERKKKIHVVDLLYPPGIFEGGKLMTAELPGVGSLPFSARRLPEFSNRRSIWTMFEKITSTNSKPQSSSAPTAAEEHPPARKRTLPSGEEVDGIPSSSAPTKLVSLSSSFPGVVAPSVKRPKWHQQKTTRPPAGNIRKQPSISQFLKRASTISLPPSSTTLSREVDYSSQLGQLDEREQPRCGSCGRVRDGSYDGHDHRDSEKATLRSTSKLGDVCPCSRDPSITAGTTCKTTAIVAPAVAPVLPSPSPPSTPPKWSTLLALYQNHDCSPNNSLTHVDHPGTETAGSGSRTGTQAGTVRSGTAMAPSRQFGDTKIPIEVDSALHHYSDAVGTRQDQANQLNPCGAAPAAHGTTPPPAPPSQLGSRCQPGLRGVITATHNPAPAPKVSGTTTSSNKTAKEKWATIFQKPTPPLCSGHQEPAIQLTCKKPGPNQGRSFWVCNRPHSPSSYAGVPTIPSSSSSSSSSSTQLQAPGFPPSPAHTQAQARPQTHTEGPEQVQSPSLHNITTPTTNTSLRQPQNHGYIKDRSPIRTEWRCDFFIWHRSS